jgi:glycosyltransferase involved in cell wall biosynthesis
MTSPLLSICIPTYNRSRYLKRCLSNIVEHFNQNPELKQVVEVIVSDNCSTDDTKATVLSFTESIPLLVYSRNDENIGFDRNVSTLITKARGKYCWYLGDDDLIIPGALKVVFEKFATNSYDLITMNVFPLWEEDGTIPPQKYANESFVELQDHNEFYFRVYCQGGVSVLAFNRELWLKVLTMNDYLEHWLYYETVLKVLAKSTKPKLFISTPAIATGQDCRWAENGTELFTYINSIILLQKMRDFGFDKERLEHEIQQNSKFLIIILLRAKGHGLKCNRKNFTYMYRHMKELVPMRLYIASVIYILPNPLVVWVRDLKKSIFNLKKV